MNRIKDKLKELRVLIEELRSIMPNEYSDYRSDIKLKAASERYFEKIVECITDVCFLVIKHKKLGVPEDDKSAYDLLRRGEIIDEGLRVSLREAKGMRNILAHDYGKVDDELVYHSITSEIIKDGKEFIKQIERVLLDNG